MDTLYAWVRPLDKEPFLDHTWVTNYYTPNPPYIDIDAVKRAEKAYWYCWGDYHKQGESEHHEDGAIGQATASLSTAQCICAPNDKGATGTIYKYGIDGVCHQVANQVLASTGPQPLTVNLARGYWASSFVYTTYGRQATAWSELKQQCTVKVMAPLTSADDFEQRLLATLGRGVDQTKKLQSVLDLRARLQAAIESHRAQVEAESADIAAKQLNEIINSYLKDAAKILGREDYKRVFGFEPGQPVNLVDPESMDMPNPGGRRKE